MCWVSSTLWGLGNTTFRELVLISSSCDSLSLYWQIFFFSFNINDDFWDRTQDLLNTRQDFLVVNVLALAFRFIPTIVTIIINRKSLPIAWRRQHYHLPKRRVSHARTRTHTKKKTQNSVSKSFRTGRLMRELQTIELSDTRYSRIAILWVSLVSFAIITLCVASQRAFVTVSLC